MDKAKLMVALRDQESVESLLTLAIQLSKSMDGEIFALHVVEVPAATPLEAGEEFLDHPGKEILATAIQVAKRFSTKLSTQLVHAREAGEAIVNEAKYQGVELLIVGHRGSHASSLSALLLGSTAQYVAHHSPCRVLIQVPPPHSR